MNRPKDNNGNELTFMGLGIGAFGIASTAILGATCPVCVVAAPALLGAGLYARWKSKRAEKVTLSDERPSEPGSPDVPRS